MRVQFVPAQGEPGWKLAGISVGERTRRALAREGVNADPADGSAPQLLIAADALLEPGAVRALADGAADAGCGRCSGRRHRAPAALRVPADTRAPAHADDLGALAERFRAQGRLRLVDTGEARCRRVRSAADVRSVEERNAGVADSADRRVLRPPFRPVPVEANLGGAGAVGRASQSGHGGGDAGGPGRSRAPGVGRPAPAGDRRLDLHLRNGPRRLRRRGGAALPAHQRAGPAARPDRRQHRQWRGLPGDRLRELSGGSRRHSSEAAVGAALVGLGLATAAGFWYSAWLDADRPPRGGPRHLRKRGESGLRLSHPGARGAGQAVLVRVGCRAGKQPLRAPAGGAAAEGVAARAGGSEQPRGGDRAPPRSSRQRWTAEAGREAATGRGSLERWPPAPRLLLGVRGRSHRGPDLRPRRDAGCGRRAVGRAVSDPARGSGPAGTGARSGEVGPRSRRARGPAASARRRAGARGDGPPPRFRPARMPWAPPRPSCWPACATASSPKRPGRWRVGAAFSSGWRVGCPWRWSRTAAATPGACWPRRGSSPSSARSWTPARSASGSPIRASSSRR